MAEGFRSDADGSTDIEGETVFIRPVELCGGPRICPGAEEQLLEAMIENIKKEGPYVVITPRVAIPHARPEDGVNVLSMSLLVVKESVDFAPEKPVNMIIVLAAIDNETHLKALAQLMEMLSSPKTIDRLLQLENKDEMMKMINHYAKEMD